MRKLLILLAVLIPLVACSQRNITKTAGVFYCESAPNFLPSEWTSSELAVDTTTGYIYQWNRELDEWLQLGQGIDWISGTAAPAYTPLDNQSKFAINAANELYAYDGATWSLVSGGGGATYTEGYGVNIVADEISVDTTQIPTSFGAASVYRLWPKGNVNSYQAASTKRNWIIYNNNIQAASTRNAFMKFDTISFTGIGSTTNISGNGIWMATSTTVADMVSGFSNNIQHGGGFNMFGSGNINFSDWRSSGTRGSVLKAFNWASGGGGDVAISFFRSQSSDVTTGLAQLGAGEEIAAIRFSAADTTRALTSTKTFQYPLPCAAIVGYTFKKQWNNAHYGGIGIWTTNGSTTQVRAVAVDSTFSTTVRAGIGVVPSPANTLQVAGQTSIAGNLALSTAGNKISIATGTNASVGTATLVGGTITINTTAVTANSIIICNHVTPIVTQGILSVPAASIVPGVSFTINSDSVADASSINWWIIN